MKINSEYLKVINYESNSVLPSDLLNKAKEGLINLIDQKFGTVDRESLQVKDYEYTVWLNTAMGCLEEGQSYAQIELAGYKVQFEYQGDVYTIHVDLEGSKIVSPDFVSPTVPASLQKAIAPSIFDLSAASAKNKSSFNVDQVEKLSELDKFNLVYVDQVKKYSDLDKNEFYFEIVLDNQQAFKVDASLEDLLNNKIYIGMPFRFLGEEFDRNEPGLSTFAYASLVGDNIQLSKNFDSKNSFWHPDESLATIELSEKWVWRSGMSNINYSIRFSDGWGSNVGAELYNKGIFNQGDKFFNVSSYFLVNATNGRVIDKSILRKAS